MVTKKQLRVRLESLEDALGLIYHVDNDGYGCHSLIKSAYNILDRLTEGVEGLEKEAKAKDEKSWKK